MDSILTIDVNEDVISKSASVLLNRNFMLLFYGKVVSLLMDQIYAFALSWYILDITKSGLLMAAFLVIDTATVALISPFGGVIADIFNRKNIMVWMDIIRGIIVIAAASILFNHLLQIWMLYISAIFLGFCGSIFTPASSSIIPDVVEEKQLTRATSYNNFSWSFCALTGMLIGGFLYNRAGIFVIFVLNAASYFISGFMEFILNVPLKERLINKQRSALFKELKIAASELAEGLRYVRGNKLIYKLIIMYSIYNLIIFPIGYIYFPYIFNVVLKATSFQLSIATGSIFLGMITASLIVPVIMNRYKLKTSIFWGLLVFCIAQVIFIITVFTPLRLFFDIWGITYIVASLSVVIGIAVTFFNIPINVIFQKHTAEEFRGRFWGFYYSLTSLIVPIGYFMGGFLSQNLPLVYVFAGSAVIMLILDIWAVNLKEIKDIQGA